MSESELLAVLARSGLDDDTYASACETVRTLVARIEAADALAVAVLEASSFQPSRVLSAATEYASYFAPLAA